MPINVIKRETLRINAHFVNVKDIQKTSAIKSEILAINVRTVNEQVTQLTDVTSKCRTEKMGVENYPLIDEINDERN